MFVLSCCRWKPHWRPGSALTWDFTKSTLIMRSWSPWLRWTNPLKYSTIFIWLVLFAFIYGCMGFFVSHHGEKTMFIFGGYIRGNDLIKRFMWVLLPLLRNVMPLVVRTVLKAILPSSSGWFPQWPSLLWFDCQGSEWNAANFEELQKNK